MSSERVNSHRYWLIFARFQCFQIGAHIMIERLQVTLDMMDVTE